MARNQGSTVSKAIDALRPQSTLDLANTIHAAQGSFLEKIQNDPQQAAVAVAALDTRIRDLLHGALAPTLKGSPDA